MKKEILILSSVGILALIIGGAIFGSQIAKQNSIERQQRAELQVKQAELDYQKEQDYKAEVDKQYNETMLNACLLDAEENYWNYAELNGKGTREDGITMSNRLWDTAAATKQNDIDNCYRKYNK